MMVSASVDEVQHTAMKILFVVSEAYPLVKTGGLGDVGGALPPALARHGVDVRVMMPAYPAALRSLEDIQPGPELGQLLGGHAARLLVSRMPDSDVRLWLVDCPSLYAREENIYNDWPDNHLRFGVLARAAAFMAIAGPVTGWRPDVVHANDWHTGLTPYYMKTWGGWMARSVFTIHNMVYQGLFDHEVLPDLAVATDKFSPAGLEFWGRVSFLKAGLVFADRVTTVSPTYAREVRRPPYGEGMEGVIRSRRDEIIGIVNGIDEAVWDPSATR
jgi:starch synthase